MKKHVFVTGLCVAYVSLALMGCGVSGKTENVVNNVDESDLQSDDGDENLDDAFTDGMEASDDVTNADMVDTSEVLDNTEITADTELQNTTQTAAHDENNVGTENRYMAFLNGEIGVTTSEYFREDDQAAYSTDGLIYGTYTYQELKAAIEDFEMAECVTKYAFVDFGQDGTSEMLLQFENTNMSLSSWTGILHDNGSGLELNGFYEYGSRTYATVYKLGYLETGGAMSAGSSVTNLNKLDADGNMQELFSVENYFGYFVKDIVYEIDSTAVDKMQSYDDIASDSELEVEVYKTKNDTKLAVLKWSEQKKIQKREKQLIDDLANLGAEVITTEEMDALTSELQTLYDTETVNDTAFSYLNQVNIQTATEEMLRQKDSYDEFVEDESEYQVKVAFTTHVAVSDFKVCSIAFVDAREDGTITFSIEKVLYEQDCLSPERALVVDTAFPGTIPRIGITYVDGSGDQQFYALSESGLDGSPFMMKAELAGADET